MTAIDTDARCALVYYRELQGEARRRHAPAAARTGRTKSPTVRPWRAPLAAVLARCARRPRPAEAAS